VRALLGFPLSPVTGDLDAPADDLALVSTSGYEQIVVYDAGSAQSRSVFVETPASFPSGRYPLLPPPGETHLRTGISTLACIFPPDPFDSEGNAIGGHAACDPAVPSYLTSFTAGKALAGGRLFVATSNLAGNDRFRPGTVLVYEWIESGGSVRVRPDPTTPVLFTEGFNASGVRRAVTAGGRELVLVTSTGAIGQGTGPGNILTQSAIEVIDPSDLYAGAGPPVILDGLSVGFPDARIFTADTPFLLPDRDDGAPSVDCDGFTHAAVNAAASEVFATDFCDGTFTRVRMDLSGDPPVPWPRARFQVAAQQTPFAPVRADTFGLLRAPGALRVRPGSPGVDYASPDVLVVVGQPEGQLCALRVESP
jgi:hypothetical protein